MNEVQGNLLIQAIGEANQAQLDALWAILKFRNMGILRKVLAMCEVLNLNSENIVLVYHKMRTEEYLIQKVVIF